MEQGRLEPDKNCSSCHHASTHHFWTTDEIGYYAFCTIGDCNCFVDIRDEDDLLP